MDKNKTRENSTNKYGLMYFKKQVFFIIFVLMAVQETLCFKGNRMTLYFLCLHLLKWYAAKKKGGGGGEST